eukprot:TRINITY_DN27758_c0_g1_i2.p1 TRINITY_DN27758_c0_g1~~TRINITY_DN27758_c0_g1_i2.p1  ORF type:complete len:314 (+),score=27.77 TRINITY_DN27758_c0_g1_i2:844-1785(+)
MDPNHFVVAPYEQSPWSVAVPPGTIRAFVVLHLQDAATAEGVLQNPSVVPLQKSDLWFGKMKSSCASNPDVKAVLSQCDGDPWAALHKTVMDLQQERQEIARLKAALTCILKTAQEAQSESVSSHALAPAPIIVPVQAPEQTRLPTPRPLPADKISVRLPERKVVPTPASPGPAGICLKCTQPLQRTAVKKIAFCHTAHCTQVKKDSPMWECTACKWAMCPECKEDQEQVLQEIARKKAETSPPADPCPALPPRSPQASPQASVQVSPNVADKRQATGHVASSERQLAPPNRVSSQPAPPWADRTGLDLFFDP